MPTPVPSQAKTVTDSSGNYSIDLPAGSYKVRASFTGTTGDYVTEWYLNASTRAAATPVTAPDDVDFSLARGGRVTGTVKNSNGTPLDMCISIFEIVNGNLRIKGNATSDASNDGFYAARNISRPGPVVVRFHHCQGDPIVYTAEWYQNKASGFSADLIPVPGTSGHFEVDGIQRRPRRRRQHRRHGDPGEQRERDQWRPGARLSGERGGRIGHHRQRRRLPDQRSTYRDLPGPLFGLRVRRRVVQRKDHPIGGERRQR